MKYFATHILIFGSVIVLFLISSETDTFNNKINKVQDSSLKDEIIKIVDSIDLYINNNDVKHGIACGDKGSWSDFRNENNELLKTESDLLIANGILLTNKHFKLEKVIFAEIVFLNMKDTIYWEDRYFNNKEFYSEIHKGRLEELSEDLSNHIKDYHYRGVD